MTKNFKLNRTKSSKSNPNRRHNLSSSTPKKRKFVLAPTDKASSNVAAIWKRYYAEVILNEIGVSGHGNNIYCKTNKNFDEITDENTAYTKRWWFNTLVAEPFFSRRNGYAADELTRHEGPATQCRWQLFSTCGSRYSVPLTSILVICNDAIKYQLQKTRLI